MKKISIGTMILSLLIPLLVGGISAALSAKGMATYGEMRKPPLSPPAWTFSVAWTLLYVMMGLASYFVITSDSGNKKIAIVIYLMQLAMNFMWSIIFFRWGAYLPAFIWLFVMWCLVILCIARFYSINRLAACLLIPYIVWLSFAAYLNMGAYVLSLEMK